MAHSYGVQVARSSQPTHGGGVEGDDPDLGQRLWGRALSVFSNQGTARTVLLAILVFVLPGAGRTPQGSTYFLAPDGDDLGAGTETSPWATLEHAAAQLLPGDVLLVRGGVYHEANVDVAVAGLPGAPITIRAYPGEAPVFDGGLAEFREAGNADWEPVDPDKGIYRSVETFPEAGTVYGYFGSGDGGYRLVSYEDVGPFSTDNEFYSETWPYYYIGPGVFWDALDERIYVRLERGMLQDEMGYSVPANTDPRQTPMFLFVDGQIIDFGPSSAHLVVEGLDLRYRNNAVEFDEGSHDIVVRDCDLRGGRYHVHARDGAHDVTLDDVRILDAIPPWVARTDVKKPTDGRPGRQFQGAAVGVDGEVDGLLITGCRITNTFDGLYAPDVVTNLALLHTTFEGIRDDVVQFGTGSWNVEFGHNRILVAHSGFSRDGTASPPSGKEGTKFVHHNVVDTSTPQRIGRPDPDGLLEPKHQGPEGDGMGVGTVFGRHNTEAGIEDPWKIYHNTIVAMEDTANRGIAYTYSQAYGPLTRGEPHEVLNNVFVQVSDQHLARDAELSNLELHDGNLLHRPPGDYTRPLIKDYVFEGAEEDFDDLAAFLASDHFLGTQAVYPPGWESGGLEADPELDADYAPAATGPAASGAVDLSGRSWPGLAGETFRGALAPPGGGAKAVDDAASTVSDVPVVIDVLANDEPGGGVAPLLVSVTEPSHGDATIRPNGTIEYAPRTGFAGVDVFDYAIDDGIGGTAEATVTVTVVDPKTPGTSGGSGFSCSGK